MASIIAWIRFSSKPMITVAAALLVAVASGCRPTVRERPYGYVRLGKVVDLRAPETNLPQWGLVLHHDPDGFYVMSTFCTYDLSPLEFEQTPQGGRYYSRYSKSSYDAQGRVLSGPASADLPYYRLQLDQGEYGGPKDTLYAQVGARKPRNWRLKLDSDAGSRQQGPLPE